MSTESLVSRSICSGSQMLARGEAEREFFIDSLLVRIHSLIEMIWTTGLAPWELIFSFPAKLISAFLVSTTTLNPEPSTTCERGESEWPRESIESLNAKYAVAKC